MRHRRISKGVRAVSALLILVLLAVSAARADEDPDLKQKLLSGWRMWRDLLSDINALTFTIGAGYSGDSSPKRDLNKLDITASVAKSGYPNDLKFDMASSIQLTRSGSKTTYNENVTTLLLSYEHYLLPFFKGYGFVERFTDTYLSIQQRYETGIGVKTEFDIGLGETGQKKIKDILDFGKTAAKARAQNITGGEDVTSALAVDPSQIQDTVTALRKKYAFLAVGLAFTTMVEIERASLDLPDGTSALIDPRRRYRYSVRPSLTLRPSEGLSLKWQTYYKLPAIDSFRTIGFDGALHYDYRTDTFVTLRYDLPKAPAWARRIALVVDYKHYFDSNPPFVPHVAQAAATHSSLLFKIQAEF
jgi:hypothetical protein